MKWYQLKVVAIALLLTGLTMSVSAQQRGQGKGQGANANAKPYCEKYLSDLTEEQQQSIEKLRVEHMSKMNTLRADMQIKRAELQKLKLPESYNQKTVDTKIDELYSLKSTMAKEKSKHRQQVRNVLTDEQKVIFDAHGPRGQGYGYRHGHGQGYGYGPGCNGGKAACNGKGPR